jgi:hypothetical protein
MKTHKRLNIVDDDGNEHHVVVRLTDEGKYYVLERYSDESSNTSQRFDTEEAAVKDMTSLINMNCAKCFEELDEDTQTQLLDFVRANFIVGVRGNSRIYNSYYLKHVAERHVSTGYISNGELKGAMQRLGFQRHKSSEPADINYTYSLKKLKVGTGGE